MWKEKAADRPQPHTSETSPTSEGGRVNADDQAATETLSPTSDTGNVAGASRPARPAPQPEAPVADRGQADSRKEGGIREKAPTEIIAPTEAEIEADVPDDPGQEARVVGGDVTSLPLAEIEIDPDRFQFKGRTNTSGVVESEQLGGDWDSFAAGNILVWEQKDGRKFAVNGHHRYDLAKRKGVERVNAHVIREADGVTANQARTLGAELNIKEGQGSESDYAEFFRLSDIDEAAAESRGLLARSKGRAGFLVGRFASDDAWAAYLNGKLSFAKAAVIADIGRGDEGLQALGLKLAKNKSADELRSTLRAMTLFPRDKKASQGDLFGFDDSAIQEAEAMGKAAESIIGEMKDRVLAVKGALKRPDKAKEMGLSGDLLAVQSEVDQLNDEIDRWSRWTTDKDLVRSVREKAGLPFQDDFELEGAPSKDTTSVVSDYKAPEPEGLAPNPDRSDKQPTLLDEMEPGSTPGQAGLFDAPPQQRRLGDKKGGDAELGDQEQASLGGPVNPVRQTRSTTPRKPDDDASPGVAAQDIIESWERMFNVPLRTGGFSSRAAGIYKVLPEVVRRREKHVANLAVAAHEIAHHIDKKTGVSNKGVLPQNLRNELAGLDYEPKARVFEGFAEFIRHWVTETDASRRAPQFNRYFEKQWLPAHPEWAKPLIEARKAARQFADQSVFKRITSLIGSLPQDMEWGERWKRKLQKRSQRMIVQQVDMYEPLRQIQEEARRRGHKGVGPYDASLFYTMTAPAEAEKALEQGVHSIRTGESLGGPALWDAAEYVNDSMEEQEAIAYAYARHTLFMHEKNPAYNTGMDAADALRWVEHMEKEGKKDRYESFARVIAEYANATLDMLVDAGRMSSEARNQLLDYYGDNYFPLLRVKEGSTGAYAGAGFVNLPPAVRARSKEGSGRKILNPFDALVSLTVQRYNQAVQARQIDTLVEAVVPRFGGVEGMGGLVDVLDPKRKVHKGTISEVLDTLVEEGVIEADDAKAMKLAARIREGDMPSRKSLAWLADRYGLDSEDANFTDYLREAIEKEPDALATISLWRQDFTPNAAKRTVLYHRKGDDPYLLEMDDLLYRVATGSDAVELQGFTKTLRSTQELFKAGAAGANTLFAGVNLLADYFTYQGRAKYVKGLRSVYKPWQALGEYLWAKSVAKAGGKTTKEVNALVHLFEETGGRIYSRLGDDASRRRVRRRSLAGKKKFAVLGAKKGTFYFL
jgi:hypothetical protein